MNVDFFLKLFWTKCFLSRVVHNFSFGSGLNFQFSSNSIFRPRILLEKVCFWVEIIEKKIVEFSLFISNFLVESIWNMKQKNFPSFFWQLFAFSKWILNVLKPENWLKIDFSFSFRVSTHWFQFQLFEKIAKN